MIDQGITTPVGEGESDGTNSLVIRKKPNGRLYICLDPKDISKIIEKVNSIQCQHYMTSPAEQ